MNIRKELLDELLQECKTPPDLFGEGGILKQLTTALVERALEAELSTHLGYKKHESRPEGQSNSRNGYSQKKVQGDFGIAEIAVPRDRQGEFEPQAAAMESEAEFNLELFAEKWDKPGC